MSLFYVDPEKCNRDGICVEECPMRIIEMADRKSVPTQVAGMSDDLCISCGHCVAVCPTGAMSLKFLKPEDCAPVKKELALSVEHVEHFLSSRRSIRTYTDKPVEKEKIEKLLEISCAGPTGHNSRSVNWLVIYDTEEVRKMTSMVTDWMRYMIKEQPDMAGMLHLDMVVAGYESGFDGICRNAPHIVMAHAPKFAPTGAIDCANALAYLELAAPSFGLGTCWAGFFNIAATFWPPLKEALSLPKGHLNHGSVLVGNPKFKYHRIPPRTAAVTWK